MAYSAQSVVDLKHHQQGRLGHEVNWQLSQLWHAILVKRNRQLHFLEFQSTSRAYKDVIVVKGTSGSVVHKFSITTMLRPRCDSCKVTFRHFHRCCKL